MCTATYIIRQSKVRAPLFVGWSTLQPICHLGGEMPEREQICWSKSVCTTLMRLTKGFQWWKGTLPRQNMFRVLINSSIKEHKAYLLHIKPQTYTLNILVWLSALVIWYEHSVHWLLL